MAIKSVFYNTNGEKYPDLHRSWSQAKTQDEYIYLIFQDNEDRSLSRDDVEKICKQANKNWPISSICRAINTLVNNDLLVKSNTSRVGQFGKKQNCWQLKTNEISLF